MLHPLFLWGPIGALVGWLGAVAFHRASLRTGASGEPSDALAGDRCEELSAYLRQQTKVTVSLLCAAFVAFLLAYFLGAQSATLPPAFLLGGLCSAGASFLGLKLAASARHRFLQAATGDAIGALDRARQASSAIGLVCHGSALVILCLGVATTFGLGGHLPIHEASLRLMSFALGAGWHTFWSQLQTLPLLAAARRAASVSETATASQTLARQAALVAGHGAELHGSHVSATLAATTLAVAAALSMAPTDTAAAARIAVLAVAVAGIGLIGSTLGLALAQRRRTAKGTPLFGRHGSALSASAVLTAAGSAPLCAVAFREFLLPNPGGWLGLWGCLVLGLSTSLLATIIASRTSAVGGNASATEQPTCHRLEALASSLLGNWPIAALLAVTVLAALKLSGGLEHPQLGMFGLALTAAGALSPLAAVASGAALSSITGGVLPSAKNVPTELPEERAQELAGWQQTVASGLSGSTQVALGAAALTTLSLLAVYAEELKAGLVRATSAEPAFAAWGGLTLDGLQARAASYQELMGWYDATLLNPLVLAAGSLGAVIATLVWAWTLRAADSALEGRDPDAPQVAPESAILAERVQAASRKAVLLTLLAPLLVSGLLGPAAAMGLVLGALAVSFTLGSLSSQSAWGTAGEEAMGPELAGVLCALSKLLALLVVLSAGAAVTLSPAALRALGFF